MHRSITTVSPTIETIRIGHMIGPPFRKWSINKLPDKAPAFSGAAAAAGAGLSQRRRQDLVAQLLPEWSRRLALQVGLLLEVVPARLRALPEAVAAAAPAARFVAGGCLPRLERRIRRRLSSPDS